MSRNKPIAYSQAFNELEKIVNEIESGDIDVDALSEKVKRATFLISLCRDRLRNTEEEVKKVLAEIKEDAGAEDLDVGA